MTRMIDMTIVDAIKYKILERAISSGYAVSKPRFKKMLDWLFDPVNEQAIKTYTDQGISFDYSEYWDLPTKISYKLSGDEVDLIQEFTSDFFNYFDGLNAFSHKKPLKNYSKTIPIKLPDLQNGKEDQTLKFLFKNGLDVNNVYVINTNTIQKSKKLP